MNLINLIPIKGKEYSADLSCCSWAVASYCEIPKGRGYQVKIQTDNQVTLIHYENKEVDLPFQIFVCKSDGVPDIYIAGEDNVYHFMYERGFINSYAEMIKRAVEHTTLGFEKECNG